MREIKLHPKHAKGKYYVDADTCLACATCYDEAPNNFRYHDDSGISYVFKQPETPEEEAQCREATRICAVEAICDDGSEIK